MDIRTQIDSWRKEVGLSTLQLGDTGEIEFAMRVAGKGISLLTLAQLDEVITILTNYLIYVAHEMGTLYARVSFLRNSGHPMMEAERAKLNIIKPVHDAIKIKIDILKKIYDRKIWEARSATSGRS